MALNGKHKLSFFYRQSLGEILQYARGCHGGELLAIHETSTSPLHVTVVGAKDDPAAVKLYAAALHSFRGYERVEWIDLSRAASAPQDVQYPALARPAAFVCRDQHCGGPIYLEPALNAAIEKAASKPEPVVRAGAAPASLRKPASPSGV